MIRKIILIILSSYYCIDLYINNIPIYNFTKVKLNKFY